MTTSFEDLRVLKATESICDELWGRVVTWDTFARDVVGKQLARAVDSIGANIAEAYGRFNYGEKLQFLYYARGSLFESRYWLDRAQARQLLTAGEARDFTARLTEVARQLNAFAGSLKSQRAATQNRPSTIKESSAEYGPLPADDLFGEDDLAWLGS